MLFSFMFFLRYSSSFLFFLFSRGCENRGGHLVKVDNQAELDFLALHIAAEIKGPGSTVGWLHELWWTGGQRDGEGDFVWPDGSCK